MEQLVYRLDDADLLDRRFAFGAGEGIRTPDPLITNQLLYRAELRQPDKFLRLAYTMPPRNAWLLGLRPRTGPKTPLGSS